MTSIRIDNDLFIKYANIKKINIKSKTQVSCIITDLITMYNIPSLYNTYKKVDVKNFNINNCISINIKDNDFKTIKHISVDTNVRPNNIINIMLNMFITDSLDNIIKTKRFTINKVDNTKRLFKSKSNVIKNHDVSLPTIDFKIYTVSDNISIRTKSYNKYSIDFDSIKEGNIYCYSIIEGVTNIDTMYIVKVLCKNNDKKTLTIEVIDYHKNVCNGYNTFSFRCKLGSIIECSHYNIKVYDNITYREPIYNDLIKYNVVTTDEFNSMYRTEERVDKKDVAISAFCKDNVVNTYIYDNSDKIFTNRYSSIEKVASYILFMYKDKEHDFFINCVNNYKNKLKTDKALVVYNRKTATESKSTHIWLPLDLYMEYKIISEYIDEFYYLLINAVIYNYYTND